jgi:hypothetical protein
MAMIFESLASPTSEAHTRRFPPRTAEERLNGDPYTLQHQRRRLRLDSGRLAADRPRPPVRVRQESRLTPTIDVGAELLLDEVHTLPEGAVEVVYACR